MNRKIQLIGFLKEDSGRRFLVDDKGKRLLEDSIIWEGYRAHWKGRPLCARYLPEKDYETGKPLLLLWPPSETRQAETPYFEIYYSERLVKYRGSRFGHAAINVQGTVYNFSYRINENERIPLEEYFFRPALGPFAPHPVAGKHLNEPEPGQPVYYDNFGRLFMRTIHVLRVQGASLETRALSGILSKELEDIRKAPRDPEAPNIYRGFHFYKRNCSTIIRDGLKEIGFKRLKGIAPRDFFTDAAFFFFKNAAEMALDVTYRKRRQLKVPEAPYSVPAPLVNPVNMIKSMKLKIR